MLEFQKCLDRAPPIPFDLIKATVEAELGRPLSSVFESVDPVPLATASVAQVHAAVLAGSRKEVVLKVLKPGVEDTLRVDLDALARCRLEDSTSHRRFECQTPRRRRCSPRARWRSCSRAWSGPRWPAWWRTSARPCWRRWTSGRSGLTWPRSRSARPSAAARRPLPMRGGPTQGYLSATGNTHAVVPFVYPALSSRRLLARPAPALRR